MWTRSWLATAAMNRPCLTFGTLNCCVRSIHFDDITEGRIIACTHDEAGDLQAFDIYKSSKVIDGIVTFYARHISYRQNEIAVKPFTSQSCAGAIQALKTNSINTNPFSYWTDKAVDGEYKVEAIRGLRGLLGGEQAPQVMTSL